MEFTVLDEYEHSWCTGNASFTSIIILEGNDDQLRLRSHKSWDTEDNVLPLLPLPEQTVKIGIVNDIEEFPLQDLDDKPHHQVTVALEGDDGYGTDLIKVADLVGLKYDVSLIGQRLLQVNHVPHKRLG